MKKRELQPLIESVMAKADQLKQPGATKADQFDFLMEMAKVGGLDNGDPEVKRLKRIWGKQLQERREVHSLSLRAVSRKALMSHKTIAAVESGDAHIARYPLAHFMLEVCIANLTTDLAKEKAETFPNASIRKERSA